MSAPSPSAAGLSFPGSFTVISDEISQELETLAAFVRRQQIDGFELRSLFGRAFKDLTDEDVAAIGALVRKEGWKIHGCATPVYKCALEDAAAIREHQQIFRRSLQVAKALDCKLVRVFTFLRRPGPIDAATVAQIAGHLRALGDIAAGSGIRIGVENESSCLIGSGEETQALMAQLDSTRFGVIWDPCNVLYTPGASAPTPEMMRKLLPSIVHLHVKDASRRDPRNPAAGMEAMPVGLGEVGWPAHFASLRTSPYRGRLSLETHWRREQIDEKLLHLPAGHAFSRGGEAASTTCFDNIQALWALGH
jgi:sugar phosphate isomerase/epimerase